MEAVLFYLMAGLAAAAAIGCVVSANIVRMTVWLFAALGSVAVLYFLMGATFLGAVQLIVYVGGTLVVIIFGVMLTSKSPGDRFSPRLVETIAGVAVCLALLAGLVTALVLAAWDGAGSNEDGFTVAQIGRALLTTYLVPFELVSVLLLAVMVGAAYLVRAERRP